MPQNQKKKMSQSQRLKLGIPIVVLTGLLILFAQCGPMDLLGPDDSGTVASNAPIATGKPAVDEVVAGDRIVESATVTPDDAALDGVAGPREAAADHADAGAVTDGDAAVTATRRAPASESGRPGAGATAAAGATPAVDAAGGAAGAAPPIVTASGAPGATPPVGTAAGAAGATPPVVAAAGAAGATPPVGTAAGAAIGHGYRPRSPIRVGVSIASSANLAARPSIGHRRPYRSSPDKNPRPDARLRSAWPEPVRRWLAV